MGYSSEAIFIKPELTKSDIENLLQALTGEEYIEVGITTLGQADRRDRYGIYVGSANGASVIINDRMDWQRDKATLKSKTEQTLIDLYPGHELLTIANFETSNSYTYHLIKEGKTIRLKSGYHPDVEFDVGEELEIEKNCYVKKEIMDGVTFYFQKSYSDPEKFEKYTHDQIGGEVAFEMTKLFTGYKYSSTEMNQILVKQFISKNDLERILSRFEQPKTNTYELHRNWDNKIPITVFNHLINHFDSNLKERGFKFNSDTNQFVRVNDKLRYIIEFKIEDKGNYFLTPSFSYRVETDYRDWFKATYGRDKSHSGSNVTNTIHFNLAKLGIKPQGNPIFFRCYDVDVLIEKINERLTEQTFPLFEAIQTFQDAINLTQGIVKLDLLMLSGNQKLAEDIFVESFDNVVFELVNSNSSQKLMEAYLKEYAERAAILGIIIDLDQRFSEKREEIQRKKALGEIEKSPKQDSTKQAESDTSKTNDKPWWKFW
ncbi:MAG: hypothetical protein IPG07_06135 [Crocinitomicaceae bacterium]|nr:hypothetical protein [Crocinitomicaceae bacterium]